MTFFWHLFLPFCYLQTCRNLQQRMRVNNHLRTEPSTSAKLSSSKWQITHQHVSRHNKANFGFRWSAHCYAFESELFDHRHDYWNAADLGFVSSVWKWFPTGHSFCRKVNSLIFRYLCHQWSKTTRASEGFSRCNSGFRRSCDGSYQQCWYEGFSDRSEFKFDPVFVYLCMGCGNGCDDQLPIWRIERANVAVSSPKCYSL